MWESLLKRNPNLIRLIRQSRDDFDDLLEIALEHGYVPSYSDVKRKYEISYYISRHPSIIEKILKKNPRSIVVLDCAQEADIQKAIAYGYKPNLRDLRRAYHLSSSDTIMGELIRQNPKNIVYYEGNKNKLVEAALAGGWIPTKRALKKNSSLAYNLHVIKFLIDKDPDNVVLYSGYNPKVIEYALKKGYKPNLRDIKNGCVVAYDLETMREFIRKDPRNIIYYKGKDESLIKEALDLGYKPNVSDVKDSYLASSKQVMEILIRQNPSNILLYDGNIKDVELTKLAIELGFRPKPADIEKHYDLFCTDSIFRLLIQKDPNYLPFCELSDRSIALEAIKLGYKPSLAVVKKYDNLRCNEFVFQYLIEQDPKSIVFYSGNSSNLVDEALSRGYIPKLGDLKECWVLARNDKVMTILIEKDPRSILYYCGKSQEIFDLAVDKGFVPTEKDILNDECRHLHKSDKIMRMMIEKDCSFITLYKGENTELVDLALKMGYNPTKKDIKRNRLLARNKTIAARLIEQDVSNLNFYKTLGDDAILLALQVFEEVYNINIPDYYADVFKLYKGDVSKFCLSFDRFKDFLKEVNISEELFLQYGFGKNYDWFNAMIKISASGNLEEFIQIKDYFFANYYSDKSNIQGAVEISSFLDILKNYSKFPELCRDIIRQNRPLTEEEKVNLNMVFSLSNVFDDGNKPKSVHDLNGVASNIKEVYREKLNNSVKNGPVVMKDTLCQLLFNTGEAELKNHLDIFGDTQILRQLLFNNRNNPEIIPHIKKMIMLTSMIEDILAIDDPKLLQATINRVLDNFDNVVKLSSQFGKLEEEMRFLYEMDIQSNLTKVSNISDMSSVIDKERTAKYGVEVLDFSDKKYCLLAHVMSHRETPEELIGGKAENNKTFICLSSISNRNQVYYTNPSDNKIIFAADVMPGGLFLQSSVSNMGSNGHIRRDSVEVDEIMRTQRGILETSHAPSGHNSEILTYRAGLKFSYIVLHGGREPTEEELALAKEYGLKFIVTQGVRETVKDPVDIPMKDDEEMVEEKEVDVSSQQNSKSFVVHADRPRSIAILTDAHGLFEPTLAVLEDARKRGITEIYSLGDNIGTGPNPSEVMDLMEEYGVISILGNHELYVSLGVDAFKDHLDHAGPHAYGEAKRNSTWTADQLREDQKQRLRITEKMINLTLGGKKILLCHDVKDFNTDEVIVDSSVYDEVFRGHIHFGKSEGNITTIPGVGIGTNAGKATYMILTEKEGGGYTREIVTVGYDKTNMRYGIIESSMSDQEKAKISSWAGVSDGTRKR